LKNLFTANGCWAGLLEAGGLRAIEVESVSKMLACGTSILGVKHYTCGNGHCPHVKYLCNTCHCQPVVCREAARFAHRAVWRAPHLRSAAQLASPCAPLGDRRRLG
jgi:hypothetical protein